MQQPGMDAADGAPFFHEVAATLPPPAPGVEAAALATLQCSNCVATSSLGVRHDRFTPEIQRATCANSTDFFEGRVTLRLAGPRASIAAHADGKVVVTATPSHTSACNALMRTVRILARTTHMRGLVVRGCNPENKSYNFQMPAGVKLAQLTETLQAHGLVAAYVPNTFPGCTITNLFVEEGAREGPAPPVSRLRRATPEVSLGPRAEAPTAPPNLREADASAATEQFISKLDASGPAATRGPAGAGLEGAAARGVGGTGAGPSRAPSQRKFSITVYGTGKVIISGLIIEEDVRAVARALVPVLWAFNQPKAWSSIAARQKLLAARAVPSAAPLGHKAKKPRVDAEA